MFIFYEFCLGPFQIGVNFKTVDFPSFDGLPIFKVIGYKVSCNIFVIFNPFFKNKTAQIIEEDTLK